MHLSATALKVENLLSDYKSSYMNIFCCHWIFLNMHVSKSFDIIGCYHFFSQFKSFEEIFNFSYQISNQVNYFVLINLFHCYNVRDILLSVFIGTVCPLTNSLDNKQSLPENYRSLPSSCWERCCTGKCRASAASNCSELGWSSGTGSLADTHSQAHSSLSFQLIFELAFLL